MIKTRILNKINDVFIVDVFEHVFQIISSEVLPSDVLKQGMPTIARCEDDYHRHGNNPSRGTPGGGRRRVLAFLAPPRCFVTTFGMKFSMN